jgi:hypothetical protein
VKRHTIIESASEPQLLAGTQAKSLLFNHIDKWAFSCSAVVGGPLVDFCVGVVEIEEEDLVSA